MKFETKQHCKTRNDDEMPSCPDLETAVKDCQKNGKRVLVSLGGPGNYMHIANPLMGDLVATTLYNRFLGGTEAGMRPLGRYGRGILFFYTNSILTGS